MKTQGIHASIIQELDFSSLDLFLIRWLRFIFIVSIGAREFMVVINYITNNTLEGRLGTAKGLPQGVGC